MKRQLFILHALLYEGAEWLSVNPARDWETIQSRFEEEGDSFLSITLPAMHDQIIHCVKNGVWVQSRLFRESSKGGPVFLRGFLDQLFDWDTGTVREGQEAVIALKVLRQILLLHSKVRALPTPKRLRKAQDGFFATERELKDSRKTILAALESTSFLEVSDLLYRDIFSEVESMLLEDDVLFKHGPGATADGSYGAAKFERMRDTWTARLEKIFPSSEFGFTNLHHYQDECPDYHYSVVSPREERPMRVTLVPKTQKTPRIIAMEPTALQFIQQGLLTLIDESIQKSPLRAHISWSDQSRNRDMARQGSVDGSMATLDLSEASDRVHVSVVAKMLRRHPLLRKAVFACRSTTAELNGDVIRLEKFAPMGSALCFAFETLAFFAMVMSSELDLQGIPVNVLRDRRGRLNTALLRDTSAYGDDLIIPTAGALHAVRRLESFGLKVNLRKSFWTGEFRESCGGDYFRGYDITVTRLREKIPDSMQDRKETWALAEFQNLLYQSGWKNTAEKVRLKANWIPTVDKALLSGIYFLGEDNLSPQRWNADLFRSEYKVLRGVFYTPEYKARGWDELFRSFIALEGRKGDPGSLQIKPFDRRPELRSLRTSWIPAQV